MDAVGVIYGKGEKRVGGAEKRRWFEEVSGVVRGVFSGDEVDAELPGLMYGFADFVPRACWAWLLLIRWFAIGLVWLRPWFEHKQCKTVFGVEYHCVVRVPVWFGVLSWITSPLWFRFACASLLTGWLARWLRRARKDGQLTVVAGVGWLFFSVISAALGLGGAAGHDFVVPLALRSAYVFWACGRALPRSVRWGVLTLEIVSLVVPFGMWTVGFSLGLCCWVAYCAAVRHAGENEDVSILEEAKKYHAVARDVSDTELEESEDEVFVDAEAYFEIGEILCGLCVSTKDKVRLVDVASTVTSDVGWSDVRVLAQKGDRLLKLLVVDVLMDSGSVAPSLISRVESTLETDTNMTACMRKKCPNWWSSAPVSMRGGAAATVYEALWGVVADAVMALKPSERVALGIKAFGVLEQVYGGD